MGKKPDYSSFFYLNPLPSWVYDIKTFQILDVNQAAIDHYGYTRKEFLALTIKDLRPQQEVPKLISAHVNIDNHEGNIYFGVFTHQKKNRELIRMEINGHKVDFLNKKCMMVVCQDVTEAEFKINQLKESEDRLKAASSIAKLGYWRLEMDANTLTWTDEVYRIWGRNREDFDLNYENFYQTIHPLDLEDFEDEQRASFAGIKEHDLVHRILLPDNSIRWVHELGRLVKDENGNPIAFEGTVQDITSQKEEEQRLKLLESVITNTNDAILITEAEPFDEPGPKIIYVNEAFTKMTGYSAEEVIGKTPRILQGPNSDKKELAKLSKALKNWEQCEITTINYKKNGDEFWINFTVNPVANEKGWYTHWVAIERDVTDQKRIALEKELLGNISLDFTFENDLSTSAKEVCNTISKFGMFDFVELWMPNLENTQLQLLANKSTNSKSDIFYKWSSDITSFQLGEGLPGSVWLKKRSLLWKDISKKDDFIRKVAAKKAGIETALGIPLLFNDIIVGVLVVGTHRDLKYLKRYVKIFEQFEQFIGSEINRKKLENDLNHLYKTIPDILCVADFQGRFLKMNQAGCDLLGYSEEEILYHPFDEFVHPDDKSISTNEVLKLSDGETTFNFENRYITKNGNILWLSWTCNSAVNEGLIYATAKDITEEKKLRELNRQASNLAKIGSWEIDLVGNQLFWSDTVHGLHDTDPKTFAPDLETAINFYREDFRGMVNEKVANSIATGVPFDFEAVIVTAKKKERWVRALGNAEIIDGKCHRIYGSFQDINDQKEVEERLLSLADNLPGVVFQYLIFPDGSDALKYVTKGSEHVWGFKPDEVIENNNLVWNQIRAGGYFDEVQKSIFDSIQTQSKWMARWKYVMPSGLIQTHLGYGTPNFLSDGTVLFNSVILDVTQEAKNEELLEQATELAKIGSWELDLINQVGDNMYWSPITREILEVGRSYNPSLTSGFEFYTEESKVRIQKAVNLLIETGQEVDEELLIITAFGNEKWIRCIGKSERVHGKCVKIYGSFQDIHISKSLEIKIREILGSISDAFYAVDKDWQFTYFNREAERLLNKKESDVLGKNIWTVFPAAIDTQLDVTYNRVRNTQKPESFEYLFPGDGKWYEVNAYPSGDGISAYFKNIDERKRAAALLEKALTEKNNILESIGDGFFTVDKNWLITYWNKEAENFLGRKREEILHGNLWDLFTDAVDTDFYWQYHKAMESGETVNFEEYYPTVGKWFEVSVYPSSEGLSVYFKDITLRKESDIRLNQANERFEKVTEATNDAIWDWNILDETLYWGGGFKNLFGYQIDKITPTLESWTNNIHPDDKDWVVQGIYDVLDNPVQTQWIAEYKYKKSDGTFADVIDRGLVIKNDIGQAIRMVGAMTDITERKDFEQQLVELNESLKEYARELELSNEQLEQFAFIASHDLQEPLRMISSFMDQLKRKYGDQLDDKALQYIHFATDGAKRMKHIILDLLEYSRAGKLTDSVEEVDTQKIMTEYQLLRRKIITEKAAKINIGKLPMVQSYKAPLTQTLHCLIDNAIKYSKENEAPQIEISAHELDNFWEFQIKDNGIGIDNNFFEKIFIIFQRLHNRDQYAGTGIGLSIAKKHIEAWGGGIWLESTPGIGSTFYFTIPKKLTK